MSAPIRNSVELEYLGIVGPLMLLIEIFAKQSGLRFLLTFLILFAGGKNQKHLRRSSEIASQVIITVRRSVPTLSQVVSKWQSDTVTLQVFPIFSSLNFPDRPGKYNGPLSLVMKSKCDSGHWAPPQSSSHQAVIRMTVTHLSPFLCFLFRFFVGINNKGN